MIRLRQKSGTVRLLQRKGTIAFRQAKGLVTFRVKDAAPVTPPVFQLDFTKDYNSQYINIIF